MSWRLFGRPVLGEDYALVNRDLFYEFAAILSAAKWDAALLQEVPPRWAERLAEATGSEHCATLTSRNWMRPVTWPIAKYRPHLAGSWEGGCNLILVRKGRPGVSIESRERATLRLWPERRMVTVVRTRSGLCLANLHASTGERAEDDLLKAARMAVEWAGDAPLVLGGDFNLRPESSGVFDELERLHGLAGTTGPRAIDHLLSRGTGIFEAPAAWPDVRRDVPDPGTGLKLRLSDHAPVVCRILARRH